MLQDKPFSAIHDRDKRYKNQDKNTPGKLGQYRNRMAQDQAIIDLISKICGLPSHEFYLDSEKVPQLTLYTPSAVVATQLRHHQKEILKLINEQKAPALYTKLKVEIRPLYQKKTSKQSRLRKISKQNATLLKELANDSKNEKLRKVLLNLSRHSED